jgi:DNA mismatch repair protein MutS2
VQILRKELKEHQQQLAASIKTQEEPQVETSTEIPTEEPYLLPGKWVSIKNQHITGKIIEVRENEVVLEAGQMIIHVQSDKLMAAKAPKKDAETGIPKSMRRHSALQNIFDRSANFKISIDLRGKKAEEALSTVSRHVDDAILLSIPQITIIHGKGDGVLRNVVHNFLKGIKEVKSMSEGHPDRGGAGMTIVEFSR